MKRWKRLLIAAGLGLFTPYVGRPEVDALLVRLVFSRRFWNPPSVDAFGLCLMYGLFLISWLAGTSLVYVMMLGLSKLRRTK